MGNGLHRLENWVFTIGNLKIKQVLANIRYRIYGYRRREILDFELVRLVKHRQSLNFFGRCIYEDILHNWNDSGKKEKLIDYIQGYHEFLLKVPISDSTFEETILKGDPQFLEREIEPYEASLRLINWIKFFLRSDSIPEDWNHRVISHAYFIKNNVEWHLDANHLIANSKAMIFAGGLLSGWKTDAIFYDGLRLLRYILHRQIDLNGSHYEGSGMYHNLVTLDFIEIFSVLRQIQDGHQLVSDVLQMLQIVIPKMVAFASTCQFSDGDVSLFNDSGLNQSPMASELIDFWRLCSGDLFVASENVPQWFRYGPNQQITLRDHGSIFAADGREVGPKEQPGHSHSDTLSFELEIAGSRFIVDKGTYDYSKSARRFESRASFSHNIPVVDGVEVEAVWDVFRVGRRSKVKLKDFLCESDGRCFFEFQCNYKKGLFIQTEVAWQRQIWKETNRVEICDVLKLNGFRRPICMNIHLHPSWDIEREQDVFYLVNQQTRVVFHVKGSAVHIEEYDWYPSFFKIRRANKLVLNFTSDTNRLVFTW